MKADVDLSTGTVRAEFTLAEYQEIIEALAAQRRQPPAPAAPKVFEMRVESDSDPSVSYAVRIWHDTQGGQHGSCECLHHKFRGAWCKHLQTADRFRIRRLAVLS